MNKLNRFLAKNPWFSYLVTGLMLTILWSAHFIIELGLTITIIFSIIIIIVYPIMPLGSANKLIIDATKELESECDPYPLLLESEDQLGYIKSAGRRQLCMINRAVALSELGRYTEAYEAQCAIDINLVAGTTLEVKALYYVNLSSFALGVQKIEESISYHAKASQITGLLKNKKYKDLLFSSLRLTSVEQAIFRKDYDTAISLLSTIEDKTKSISVSKAFLYGKIAIAQRNTEAAKNNLLFVINNGNRLGCVEEARQILATL